MNTGKTKLNITKLSLKHLPQSTTTCSESDSEKKKVSTTLISDMSLPQIVALIMLFFTVGIFIVYGFIYFYVGCSYMFVWSETGVSGVCRWYNG